MNTEQTRQSAIKLVISRILGVIGIIPCTLIYFSLLIFVSPFQYIATGKHTVVKTFHSYIQRILDKYGL